MKSKTVYAGLYLAVVILFSACSKHLEKMQAVSYRTICNPLNISYRFQPEIHAGSVNGKVPSYREGADPTVVLFHDEYYAFVSHSGGYFHSADLIQWDLIVPNEVFPVEAYAPTAVVMEDEIYLIASGSEQVIKTSDPQSGVWETVNPAFTLRLADPALFLDDDGRLYCYAGCSNRTPIYGYELDPKTFEPINGRKSLIYSDKERRGWEEKSDYNTPVEINPHIEGAWMNKHNGKYYLQYASPGTEMKSYNDGVFVSDSPLGPFTLAEHNPFAYKPEGFACGAGHGSTFQDRYGNYWHIGTVTISMRHMFERRLSLFPLFFDEDDEIVACTGFGDYPMIVPDKKITSAESLFPGWMLLSYGKKVEVSSTLPGYPSENNMWKFFQHNDADNITDEDIRTWWSAATGGKEEWFTLDLGEMAFVYALQINFADEGAQLYQRQNGIYYQYTIETSTDGNDWEMLVDRSDNTVDMPHDYIQLERPVKSRFFRMKNHYVPSGNFSVSDFRVFGKSDKNAPSKADSFTVERDDDRRTVKLKWDAVPDAVGYVIRFGTREGKLYHHYMVYDQTELAIHSLDAGKPCFFTIDAFNEGGVTKGTTVRQAE